MGRAANFCNSSATKIKQNRSEKRREKGPGTSQVCYEARHQAYGGTIVEEALIRVRRQSMEWRRRLQAGLGKTDAKGGEKEVEERRWRLYRSIGVGNKPKRERIGSPGRIPFLGRVRSPYCWEEEDGRCPVGPTHERGKEGERRVRSQACAGPWLCCWASAGELGKVGAGPREGRGKQAAGGKARGLGRAGVCLSPAFFVFLFFSKTFFQLGF